MRTTTEAPSRGRPTPTGAGSAFATLTREVQALGLMRRRHAWYWTRLVGAVVALATWAAGCLWIGDSWWQLAWAVALAVVLAQTAFLGHDAAHRQIFTSGRWNDWVSLVLADLLVGISYGWWRGKHARHHANPNREAHDPDIAPGALAFTPAAAGRSRRPMVRWLVARQGWWFFPLTLLEGVSLHADGIRRVLSREKVDRRWVELGFLTVRLLSLPVLLLLAMHPTKALAALGVELAVFGLYLGSSFAPNHIGMPVVPAALRLDFLRRQVLMSRNITGGRAVTAAMGGLDYQIEHHLFPSMPRPNLRRVQPLVQSFCAAESVPYTATGLWTAWGQVVTHLNGVGLAGRDPFLCPLVAQRRAL